MPGPFVHDVDPIIATVGGVHVWWYGLGFALGFWQIHRYLRRHRESLRLDMRDVYSLSLCVVVGVLVGGRLVEVSFDEWPFYREHLGLVPAYWLGGMATHGLLAGAASGLIVFAYAWRRSLLRLADALVVPGAFLMGVGRLGNFIDGQIVGSVTDVWWAFRFPDAQGFRHPVVLYDGVKNLLLVPYLMRVRATNPTPGATAARFVFWYAFLRIFIDLFRDYPSHRLALGTGQTLNLVMAALGALLLVRSRLRRLGRLGSAHPMADVVGGVQDSFDPDLGDRCATGAGGAVEGAPRPAAGACPVTRAVGAEEAGGGTATGPARMTVSRLHPVGAAAVPRKPLWWQRALLAALLLFCLAIPSNWTQDVPARYGRRHPGLQHSWLYPDIDTAPRRLPPPNTVPPR